MKVGLFALALGLSGTAHAGVSDDFAGCDGLKKPKGKDDGMRDLASLNPYSARGRAGTGPLVTIAACGRALTGGKLQPTQTLRRAHLLRARAAALLELGEPVRALEDLDAAEAAVGDRSHDVFYSRSMGASLTLLRAVAKASLGENAEARRLADEAAALRPYALQVQVAASMIRHTTRPLGDSSTVSWQALARLEPQTANPISREAEVGNFAGVVALAEAAPVSFPSLSGQLTDFLTVEQNGAGFSTALGASIDLAYAYAATGDSEAARAQVARICTALDAAMAGEEAEPCGSPIGKLVKMRSLDQVEARIAVNEGRPADAQAKITTLPLVANAKTIDLIEGLRAISPEAVEAGPYTDDLRIRFDVERRRKLGQIGELLLIAPESERKVIDYEKSRPNILGALVGASLSFGTSLLGGIERTAGFSSTENPDGTVTVEFRGSTTSGPMVQEMTLLRAAEMARAANSDRFAIVDRTDYIRFMTTTQYGVETSRVPVGYQTKLVVRFNGVPETQASSLDAVAVIDALGPLYYDDDAGTRVSAR